MGTPKDTEMTVKIFNFFKKIEVSLRPLKQSSLCALKSFNL